MIYMWRTVERKKKSHFDGTSSYTYQSYWNRKKYTKKIQLLCFHFFFSYFFLLLLDIVSFTLYMRRTVKRIKNSIWRDFFLYIWIFLEPGKIYKKKIVLFYYNTISYELNIRPYTSIFKENAFILIGIELLSNNVRGNVWWKEFQWVLLHSHIMFFRCKKWF
jgi:hypothetical protein